MSTQTSISVLAMQNASEKTALTDVFSGLSALRLCAVVDSDSEAFKAIEQHRIDVVVLDLGLSGLNAFEFIEKLRRHHANVRVVVVTASNLPEDIFRSMDAGADGYVLKANLKKALGMAVGTARLGAVWLDPGIAQQVLKVIESAHHDKTARVLPTGKLTMPMKLDEKSLLDDVASASCTNGVCMVDPAFIRRIKRFAPK